jgi:hypothetical protein
MNYLIVNEWKNGEAVSIAPKRKDLIRRVNCSGRKGVKIGQLYQNQLNNGVTMEQSINNNKIWYSVCYIPYSQAREHNNFNRWENCPIFKEGEVK